jgi:hypothetical protein
MKAFRASTIIAASPDAIWAILTDASRYPEWDPGVERIEGQIAPGERITAYTKLSPGRAFPVTVAEFIPGQKMVWGSKMPLGMFKGERTFALKPQPDGRVEVTVEERFRGWLLPLIGRSLPNLTPTFESFLAGLKRRAEGG